MVCSNYISGMSDMVAIHQAMFAQSAYCFPKFGLPTEQPIRNFLK